MTAELIFTIVTLVICALVVKSNRMDQNEREADEAVEQVKAFLTETR